MKNRATVFSVESAEMKTRKFAIVTPTKKPSDQPMPSFENALQDYLLRVMREDGLSFQNIEDNARAKGGTLGRGTIQQIAKGSTANPGIFTLVELSWGIKRPLEEVVRVALGSLILNPEVFEKSAAGRVWASVENLPAADQKMIKRYLQMIEREIQRLLSGD